MVFYLLATLGGGPEDIQRAKDFKLCLPETSRENNAYFSQFNQNPISIGRFAENEPYVFGRVTEVTFRQFDKCTITDSCKNCDLDAGGSLQ